MVKSKVDLQEVSKLSNNAKQIVVLGDDMGYFETPKVAFYPDCGTFVRYSDHQQLKKHSASCKSNKSPVCVVCWKTLTTTEVTRTGHQCNHEWYDLSYTEIAKNLLASDSKNYKQAEAIIAIVNAERLRDH